MVRELFISTFPPHITLGPYVHRMLDRYRGYLKRTSGWHSGDIYIRPGDNDCSTQCVLVSTDLTKPFYISLVYLRCNILHRISLPFHGFFEPFGSEEGFGLDLQSGRRRQCILLCGHTPASRTYHDHLSQDSQR